MDIKVSGLSKDHDAVQAAKLMAEAHSENEGISEPLSIVHEQFPALTVDQLICLWIGINMARNPL